MNFTKDSITSYKINYLRGYCKALSGTIIIYDKKQKRVKPCVDQLPEALWHLEYLVLP
jgi:hypothetical protein